MQLIEKLTGVFGHDGLDSRRFAVRSSAIAEDSDEMSAAGQMTTILGVSGRAAICRAVVQCWASQFSLTALNYRRQYGQPLNGGMAVAIQEMAEANCAGVTFTCDPVSGRPDRIVINGSFGLGESVVSAAVEPDSFILRRKADGSSVELIDKVVWNY